MRNSLGWFACVVGLAGSAASAENARIAVHPLEAPGLSPVDQETLQAFFAMSVSRLKGIRLPPSAQVEKALHNKQSAGCDDACLQALAVTTESGYSLHVTIVPHSAGKELSVTGRVVRANGEGVRKLTLNAPVLKELAVAGTGHELLEVLLKSLELGKLSCPPGQVEATALGEPEPSARGASSSASHRSPARRRP